MRLGHVFTFFPAFAPVVKQLLFVNRPFGGHGLGVCLPGDGSLGGTPRFPAPLQTKKADVTEHPEVFDHVGLLVNEPPGTAGLPFI